jgi:predicted metal-dependent phosphoesterase TrpH
MPHYDLHSHSTFSDGLLDPAALVRRAASRGVDFLALTDHDELAGLPDARAAAQEAGIELVNGSELSAGWEDLTIHVVALRIDPADPDLVRGLESIRDGRRTRARRIADSLVDAGIPGPYEGALKHAGSDQLITRTHFARHLIEIGRVRDMKEAFAKFLTPGKPGYVTHAWATMTDAIGWIRGAGGQAVLAHPGRYKVDERGMRRLLTEFRDAGGDAIEVLSASHSAAQTTTYARHARVLGLKASSGSDFHGTGESSIDLGDLPPLPAGVVPVWGDW